MRRDRVTPELHASVLRRDGGCVLRFMLDSHVCRDQWGEPHPYDAFSKLTVDHVHSVPGGIRGKRAPSDAQHLVAMCAKFNIDGPSRVVRQQCREYLRNLMPA